MDNKYEKICTYVLVAILFILLGVLFIQHYVNDNVSPFVSQYDGQNYEVRQVGTKETRQTAADYLAKIRHKLDILVGYMYKKQLPDRDTSVRLYTRWKNIELKETNSSDSSAAFTLNKSTEIRLCIRNGNGGFEDQNTSMFVLLHELAHVMSIGYGHTEEFSNNFDYIVHLASQLGLYKPENFSSRPKTYCGVEINTTPCDRGTCDFGTRVGELHK